MKTTGRRIKQVTKVTRQMLDEAQSHPERLVPLPPAPHWFARGPRGGVYLAAGERSRSVGVDEEDFMRDLYTVLDESEDSRYVRPGTKLYAEAMSNET